MNRPFVVAANNTNNAEQRFAVRRRVFLCAEDARVECENEHELGLAFKLITEYHNRWQEFDEQNQKCIEETEKIELETKLRMENEDSTGSSEDEAQSDEDISIQEWGQMGYKWFRREDVTYI